MYNRKIFIKLVGIPRLLGNRDQTVFLVLVSIPYYDSLNSEI